MIPSRAVSDVDSLTSLYIDAHGLHPGILLVSGADLVSSGRYRDVCEASGRKARQELSVKIDIVPVSRIR